MAKTKKMNESNFAKLLKEATVLGELIAARQDEKQSLMDQFDGESKRFFFGKISERALAASVRKTNSELRRIDNEIRGFIKKADGQMQRAMTLATNQRPKVFVATLSGIKAVVKGAKKKASKKKPAKKKASKKKASPKKKKASKKSSKKKK
ncbi:hypothetical protein K9L16_03480 [Candidatus Pacearchaeota archaeon]|nr:hypothetical protein [Candidatus Pacearchaeota archaeon]